MPPADAGPGELLSVLGSPIDPRGRVVVQVTGEVDHYTAPLLAACLDGQSARRKVRTLVVDLAGVTFLGAAGVAVLVRARRRCLARGARLVVRCDGRREVLRPIELSGLAPLLGLEEDGARRSGRRGPARGSGGRRDRRGAPGRG